MTQKRTINELATIIRGVSYKPADVSETEKDGYVPLLRAMNIDDGTLNFSDLVYVNPKRVHKVQQITKGDVVIAASTGSKKVIGKAAQSKQDWNGSFGAFCIVLRPNSHHIDVNYFGYFFQSVYYRKLISHMSSGANINNLKREYFDRLSIPVPSVSEQEKIVTHLDQADSLRQKRKQTIDLLDEYLKSVFFEMFYTKDYEERPLGSLAIEGRGTFSNGPFGSDLLSSELKNEGVPVIYIRDIRDGVFNWRSGVYVTTQKANSLTSCHVMKGDLLVAKVGDPPGKAAIYPNDELAIMTQDVIRIRTTAIVSNVYLQYWLNSELGKHALEGIIIQGTRQRFSLGEFKKINVPVPPIELQNKFAQVVNEVEVLKQKMHGQSKELDNQFNALMQKHFNSN